MNTKNRAPSDAAGNFARSFFFAAIFSVPILANAAETTGDFPLCDTYASLKEVWGAISNKDARQYRALTDEDTGACFVPKAGLPISIVKQIGVIYRIRLYAGSESAIFYTNDDGFKR